MQFLSYAKNEGAAQHSFALQYTSVILIVLAFTIGALASKISGAPASSPEKREARILPLWIVIAPESKTEVSEWQDIGATIEGALTKLEPISEVLKNHDLTLELEIRSSDVDLGFRQAALLSRYLTSHGVPAEGFSIEVIEAPAAAPIRSRLVRS